jgi:hypothetical protein
MSADRHRARALVGLAALVGMFGMAGAAQADDEEAPDLEFLEYLGSWEASDEDWVIFTASMEEQETSEDKENVQGSDPSPDGDKLAELDNES